MNNFTDTLLRRKHIIVSSIAIIALTLYIVPIDHIFSAPGAEAKTGGGDNKYGRHKFGTPPGQGGTPPGNTPGGSDIPPGLQNNPSKDSSDNGGGSNTPVSKDSSDNSGGSNTAEHKSSAHKSKGNSDGGNNNADSHKASKANKNND